MQKTQVAINGKRKHKDAHTASITVIRDRIERNYFQLHVGYVTGLGETFRKTDEAQVTIIIEEIEKELSWTGSIAELENKLFPQYQPKVKNPELTKFDQLKASIIQNMHSLINDWQLDIDTGIEEGLYEAKENVSNYERMEQMRKELAAFEAMYPSIYIYVEGGNIQGASANCNMGVNIFDKDNYDQDTDPDKETPDQWDAMIEQKKEAGEIIGVY